MKRCRRQLWLALVLLALLPQSLAGGGDSSHGEAYKPWYDSEADYSYTEVLVTMLLLAVALCFEKMWHWLFHRVDQAAGRHHDDSAGQLQGSGAMCLFVDLMNRAGGEFMTLGFLAFNIFIFNSIGGFHWCKEHIHARTISLPSTDHDWLHVAEIVHMQLFLGMLVYFVVIARAVSGGVAQIQAWERVSARCNESARDSSSRCYGEKGLKEMEDYENGRQYFVTRMLRWQQRSPERFYDIMAKMGIDYSQDDAGGQFQELLNDDFDLGQYLSLNVAAGIRDAIKIHPKTWAAMIVLFGFFAVLHRYADIALPLLMPGFTACAVALLLVMHFLVKRKQRHFYQHLQSDAEVSCHRGAKMGPTRSGAMVRRVNEKYSTEMFALRLLQVALFLISYVLARTLLDVHAWREYPKITLLCASLYSLVIVVLAIWVPTEVPLFLGIMAMPPYVDTDNFNTFCTVLVESKQEREKQIAKRLVKMPTMVKWSHKRESTAELLMKLRSALHADSCASLPEEPYEDEEGGLDDEGLRVGCNIETVSV